MWNKSGTNVKNLEPLELTYTMTTSPSSYAQYGGHMPMIKEGVSEESAYS